MTATAKASAVAAKASGELVRPARTPPSSDPARKPPLPMELATPLQEASCWGVEASAVNSAACAGVWAVVRTVTAAASTSTKTSGASTVTTTVRTASRTARPTQIVTSTFRRDHRSAARPATGASTPAGTIRANPTMPTAAAPPTP